MYLILVSIEKFLHRLSNITSMTNATGDRDRPLTSTTYYLIFKYTINFV